MYSCFLCLWNSRADEQHYSRKLWPLREELTPGAHNVIRQPLVQREKILLPTLKGAARGGAEGAQAPPLAIRILMVIS